MDLNFQIKICLNCAALQFIVEKKELICKISVFLEDVVQ